MAAEAECVMGSILLDIGKIDDALRYLDCSLKEGRQEHNEWSIIWGLLMLAFAYLLKKDQNRTIHYLHEFVESSRKVEISVRLFPYLFEILWAIEQEELPSVNGLSLEKEIFQSLEGKNIFLRGFAHRCQALLQRKRGSTHEEIIQSLNLSMKFFHHFF